MFMLFHALGIGGPLAIVLGVLAMIVIRVVIRGLAGGARRGNGHGGARGW
jgi:hypothetical protein